MIEADRFNGIELSLIRQVMAQAAPNSINMALGELQYPMPLALKKQAHILLESGDAVYTPNAGLAELRKAIVAYYGSHISPEQLCVTNGVEEAIFISLFSLSNPGDKIAIPDPDYTAYPAIAGLLGLPVVRLGFEADLKTVDWDRWEQIISMGIKFLLLSNPQNPSGKYFKQSELTRLAEIANRYGIIVIIDEIYRELSFGERQESAIGLFEHCIVLGGLSKSHCMSGWRLGWILSDVQTVTTATKAKQYVSTCAHWLSQNLAIYALSYEGMKAADDIRTKLYRSKELAGNYLLRHINPERVFIPQAGPYMMIDIHGDDLVFAQEMAARGLIVVPGSAFGKLCRGLIRINFALEEPLLIEGLKVLAEGLDR